MRLKNKLIALLLLGFSHTLYAQNVNDIFQFDPEITYSNVLESPAEFLGYELGDEYTHHYQVVAYFKYLAENTDRMIVETYGKTYEGRELIYATITSSQNHNNLESIREHNLDLANPESSTDIEDHPIVVWLSYNVHGNEPSSSESAMQTAYRFAAANDEETIDLLRESVIIIDPMINPDGRDRYVTWYKSSQANILNTNAADLEHDEIWPGGRTNHYWFDLNRDWVWLVHPESQGRIKAYQRWLPQVHLDLHEQGFNANYFTMPGTTPRNLELPDSYEAWSDKFGRGAIEAFDEAKVDYATREAFDFFYPGYGSSYPSVMGAIGMLAEQGGHSRGGRAVETEDGYVLSLRQRVFDHYSNSVSIVKTAVTNREGLLNYYKEAFEPKSKKGDETAYFLPNNPNDYTYDVINMLMKHNVEIEQLESDATLRAYDYKTGNVSQRRFSAGDFMIRATQPKHLFVNTLFKRNLDIEDSVMYDMSTWSVPQAFNLDAAWTNSKLNVKSRPVTDDMLAPSGVSNAEADYAFVIDWTQKNAPKALSHLWNKGYKVRTAGRTFTTMGKTYSAGTLIVLLGRNRDKIDQATNDMKEVAQSAGVLIQGLDTGRMDDGMDLGSRSSNVLQQPKVAMMVDRPFNSYTAGQLWFLFDRWTEFGISRIRTGSLSSIDLNEYDVLLMPGANGLNSALSKSTQEEIENWVRAGGTLIATESAADFFTKDRNGLTDIELVEDEENEDSEELDTDAYTRFEALEDTSGLRRIPGSSFNAILDNSHPLAFGMPDEMYSLKFRTTAFKPSSDYRVVGYYHKDASKVLASGYASDENKTKAAGNAFIAHQSVGSGNVVLILDNTQYRMFWVGPARLVQNAVMLVPSF